MKNVFLKTNLMLIGMMFFSLVFAQQPVWRGDPQANERVIGTVAETNTRHIQHKSDFPQLSLDDAYRILLEKARKEFPNRTIDLRNVRVSGDVINEQPRAYWGSNGQYIERSVTSRFSMNARVIEFISPQTKMNETLVKALDRAMSNVRAGSRLAIEQISVSGSNLNRETVNDQLLTILMDNGYRIVAKEFLEKLKAEQEEQQRGGYNERTTAKTDNLSGVGYFLNVRVTEKSIRVQVINVSTGEYEGNATVDF